jgi:hypothetical protein
MNTFTRFYWYLGRKAMDTYLNVYWSEKCQNKSSEVRQTQALHPIHLFHNPYIF